MDFISVGLTLASLAFLLGATFRIRRWRKLRIPVPAPVVHMSLASRVIGWMSGLADAGLLRRTWRTGRARWVGHTLLLLGFIPLFLLHALDDIITRPLFPAYEPTLDPWQFLRNLLGLISVIGLGILLRQRLLRLRLLSRAQDWLLLGMVGGILVSGFLLEASKIMSESDFTRMVDSYYPEAEGDELDALRLYWAEANGVRFEVRPVRNPDLLALGAEVHEDRCAACHAPTATAFVSRGLAAVLPASMPYPQQGQSVFWYLHVGLSLLGFGLMPWGKFFHPVSTSVHLIQRQGRLDSQSIPVRDGLGLNACTRCGQCSLHCSVAPSFAVLGNPDILPMDKLADLRRHLDQGLSGPALVDLVEGSHICTECLRCTTVCSAGIDLQSLWMRSKQALATTGQSGVDGEIRKRTAGEWARTLTGRELGKIGSSGSGLADRAESFWGCVQCTTCTSVCPVVAVSDDPSRDLDLTPQQIMNLLRMSLKAQTLGARMVWSCTTCYKCQEHCPQGVPVADILYELRELGAKVVRDPKEQA